MIPNSENARFEWIWCSKNRKITREAPQVHGAQARAPQSAIYPRQLHREAPIKHLSHECYMFVKCPSRFAYSYNFIFACFLTFNYVKNSWKSDRHNHLFMRRSRQNIQATASCNSCRRDKQQTKRSHTDVETSSSLFSLWGKVRQIFIKFITKKKLKKLKKSYLTLMYKKTLKS